MTTRRNRAKAAKAGSRVRIGDVVTEIVAGKKFPTQIPRWPPDAFAIAAYLLQKSGAYVRVVEDWPPNKSGPAWNLRMERVGKAWRRTSTTKTLPREVEKWWEIVVAARRMSLDELRRDSDVACALLQIVAAADEACEGVGLIYGPTDTAAHFAFQYMLTSFSLCSPSVNHSRVVVLPKLHTPQAGITLRSLTHNLALYTPGEVEAVWRWINFSEEENKWNLRLLLLPWPKTITPETFGQAKGTLRNMPENYGFFRCNSPIEPLDIDHLKTVFDRACAKAGAPIDGIIFPELALRAGDAERAAQATGAFVVAGVATAASNGEPGRNEVVLAAPLRDPGGATIGAPVSFIQSKHHRWKLDDQQIRQYGLTNRLDPRRFWWEHIAIGPRKVHFVTLTEWLTVSFLICEDLARLDPVMHLLHSVGPNLIICLLMDGPQLKSRWPARYSTVLADDPGSSVLTLTSLGMASASKPPKRLARAGASRTVALWKDAVSGEAQELKLRRGADGIVLTLTGKRQPEWSADGRKDKVETVYLVVDKDGVQEV
jgi:predicted amidohydrolase